MKELWVEKYRPQTINDYVFKDSRQKAQIEQWISNGVLPTMLLSGAAGVGKTSLAKLLFKELNVNPFDIKEINASKDNGVDFIRDSVINFAQTTPFGEFKYILMDEADYLSPSAQAVLRNVIEKYSSSVRFIFTCVTGDTKVYTPHGYKRICNVMIGDKIQSTNETLINRALVRNKSVDTYTIHTLHGRKITATGNHVFKTPSGNISMRDVSVGTVLPIELSAIYGNNYEYIPQTSNFFDVNEFKKFLTSKKILTNEELATIRKYPLFTTPSQLKIVNFILDNSINVFTTPKLAILAGVNRTAIRRVVERLGEFILSKKFCNHEMQYTICLNTLRNSLSTFNTLFPENTRIGWDLRNYETQEDKIAKIPVFTEDHIAAMGRLVGFTEGDGHLSTTFHCAADNESTLIKIHHDVSKFIDIDYNCRKNGSGDTRGLCSYYNNKILKLLLEFFGAHVGNKSRQVRKLTKFSENTLFFKNFIQGLYDADGLRFKILNDDLSTSSFKLGQAIYDKNQISYFNEISEKLKEKFCINTYVSIISEDHCTTFSGSNMSMALMACTSSDKLLFMEKIGHYYDKEPTYDIMAYLWYKEQMVSYNFLRFSQWKETYYNNGILNDVVVSITSSTNEVDVYDCSFETNHWYITNGFVSHNCNYQHKILPAIHSRCQGFHIDKLDQSEFIVRMANILINENIEFEIDVLDIFVAASYPDLRKCINMVQQNCYNNKLNFVEEDASSSNDFRLEMVSLFKAGKYKEARTLICQQASPEEYDDVYRFLYQNLNLFAADDVNKEDKCIIAIRDGLVKHTMCSDVEINLSATLTELSMIAKGIL